MSGSRSKNLGEGTGRTTTRRPGHKERVRIHGGAARRIPALLPLLLRYGGDLHECGRSAAGPVHWPDCPAPFPPLVGGSGLAYALMVLSSSERRRVATNTT